jgi:predicted transcriptional regulator
MTTEAPMKTDRQLASDLVERMPESATLDEIREELAILAAIMAGIADADAGRVLSHEEVMRRSATWISQ